SRAALGKLLVTALRERSHADYLGRYHMSRSYRFKWGRWVLMTLGGVRLLMIHVDNFSNGALNPAFSYAVSCVGCFLGLRCTTRARAYQGSARARWLTLAALSIGGTGIWVMHFIAMLGFSIPGEPIRYNVPV